MEGRCEALGGEGPLGTPRTLLYSVKMIRLAP